MRPVLLCATVALFVASAWLPIGLGARLLLAITVTAALATGGLAEQEATT